MRRVLLVVGVGLAAGCGGAGATVEPDPSLQERERASKALQRRNEELAAQVRELSARLALGEAELRELRAARRCDDEGSRAAVRIGRSGSDDEERKSLPWEEAGPAADDQGSRPVLRLYGTRRGAPERDPGPVPEVPDGLPERLPVAPLPTDADGHGSTQAATREGQDPVARKTSDRVHEAYREGLALLQRHRFGEAEAHFAQILTQYPDHPRVADALYWRAEALYALRRYGKALRAFERVLKEHGSNPRAGEAMFKMGLCEKRLGRSGRARELFQRVQRDYPGTVAARMAAEEDPS